MERKICFILDASDQGHGGGQTPVQRATPPLTIMGQESVQAEEWGYVQKEQSALTVILKLATSGLTNTILIVLNTVDSKFQGWLVPISLRPVLTTVGALSWLQAGHHAVNLFHLAGVSVSTRQLRIWLKILSIALEKELKFLDYA